MKKGLFGKVSRSLAACALTTAVAALSLPFSAFAAGNATLSLRHFTAGSGTVEQGSASMRVFLDSAPGEYTVTDGEGQREIRFATLSDAVRAQYGVEEGYLSYASVSLQGNEAVTISGLPNGAKYQVQEDTAALGAGDSTEPYYFDREGVVSENEAIEAVSVDHKNGETPVVIRKTWLDGNRTEYRPNSITVRIDALDQNQKLIEGESRLAVVKPNADGRWYFVEGLHRLEKATASNARRASASDALLASASDAEREGEVQTLSYYRIAEVSGGSAYVLNFPVAERIRQVGAHLNFDIANRYYGTTGNSGGGRSYTGGGRATGRSAAYRNSSTGTAPTSSVTEVRPMNPANNNEIPNRLAAPSRDAGISGPVAVQAQRGKKSGLPKTGQASSAAAAAFSIAGLALLLYCHKREEY